MSLVPPASQSWPLPESVPTTLIVYCCLDPHNVPSTDELSDVALRWMADNIPMPHHDIIAMWFRMPVSGIAAMSKAQLPQDILHRHLVMTDALTQEMIQYATHAIMIKSEGPCVSSSTGLWPCVAAGFACMYRYGGVMVDLDMSAKIQPRKILDMMTEYLLPRAAMFVRTVHVEDQGRLKIIVHGMLHFGLPALVVDNVPRGLGNSCERGLMGVAQIVGRTALLLKARSEQPSSTLEFPIDATVSEQDVQVAYGFAADGAARSIDVRLELEPDGNPAFIKVLPPRHRANDFVGWINEFASAFASPLPSTASHLYHDEAMEEAHGRAVAELPYARQRFLSGEITPGMTLVKYAFRVNEHQSEYMWLAVREWGKMITGELINQPVQRADLKMGQIVTIDSADVYDWVVAGPGGPEGGYTDRVRAQASPASPPVNEPLPPADLIPDYVKLRGDPEFARRVNEAGREYIAAEQLPRWRLGRSHTSQQLTNAGILFAVAAIFAVATIYWLAVILASIGAFMLARNVKLHGRIGGILCGGCSTARRVPGRDADHDEHVAASARYRRSRRTGSDHAD